MKGWAISGALLSSFSTFIACLPSFEPTSLEIVCQEALRVFISFSSYEVPCAETPEGGECTRGESLWLRTVQEAEHGSGPGSDPQDAPREEQDHLPSSHAAGAEAAWALGAQLEGFGRGCSSSTTLTLGCLKPCKAFSAESAAWFFRYSDISNIEIHSLQYSLH